MRDKEKKGRRRGRHAGGGGQDAGYEQAPPGARPPEMAGRQVFPPTGEEQYGQGVPPQAMPAQPQQPGQPQPYAQPQVELVPPQVQQAPQPFETIPRQPVATPPVQPSEPAPVQPVAPQPPVPHAPPTVVSQEPFGVKAPPVAAPVEPEAPSFVPPTMPQAPPPVTQAMPPEPQAPPVQPWPMEAPAPERTAAPAPPEPVTQPEAPQAPAAPEAPGLFPPGAPPGPGYYFPPPWYPPPYTMAPPYFGFPGPGQTGPIPVVPGQMPPPESPPLPPAAQPMLSPGAFGPAGPMPPGFPPGMYPPMAPPPMDLRSLEEPEFESLTHGETSHWRIDLKWAFGIIAALFIFLALASAGLYRVTGPGAARQVLLPVIENATQVKQFVKENYQELRNKARRSRSASIFIPDIGVTISIKGDVIASLSSDDLADRVIVEAERQIYSQGYKQSLPMKAAQGAGEERAKAVCVTVLSKMNKSTHSALFWPIIIFGVLALAFGILLLIFCRGWGKAIGAGIAIIMGALPGSLMLRVGHQFFWKAGAAGTYRPVANQAMRTMSSLAIAYFDIALAFGALVLLVGVIGAIIARKSRERIPPFTELKQPDSLLAGTQQPDAGPQGEQAADAQGIPPGSDSFFLKT